MRETTNIEFFKDLRKDIVNDAVVIKGVMQGGYSIQDNERHRILRVQKQKNKYKCTCDREKSRHIFDRIKDDYANCEGFEYKAMKKGSGQMYRVLHLKLYDDIKTFIMTVINEYFEEQEEIMAYHSSYDIIGAKVELIEQLSNMFKTQDDL